jgi:hypothetical protein
MTTTTIARPAAPLPLPARRLSRPIACPACGDWCELVPGHRGRLHLLDIGVRTLSHWNRLAAGAHECARKAQRPHHRYRAASFSSPRHGERPGER